MIKKLLKKIYLNIKKINVKIKLKKILIRDEKKAIFLIGSPLHGNIGDHAISMAERKLLENIEEKIKIEIPGEYYNLCSNYIKKMVKENDIILITGGGFIGSLWLNEEKMVRNIIETFNNNRIIIMPQTVYFEDNKDGKRELEISKRIYENHPDLWLFVREERSFLYCKKNLGKIKNIFLVPDIVTYLDYQLPREERKGVLFCLRKDKEKVISNEKINSIMHELKKMNLNIKNTTTVINKRISMKNRKKIVENKLMEFKKSNLVITDRLHGMIFAAITATPCIAMDNLSGKVKGVYEWFKSLGYIKFATNIEDILNEAKELMANNGYHYNNEDFNKKFNKIIELLNEK